MRKILTNIFVVIVFTLVSCGTNKVANTESNINTIPNLKYEKSRKSFYGKLNNLEYKNMKSLLEKELNTNIPEGKTILINYDQKANNCISYKFNATDIQIITNNRVRISSRISANNNTIDFFVFSKDAFHKELYSKKENFILDTGFFYDTIFTLHENCSGFFILKANGDFLKYYGEDYYSEVSSFFKKKLKKRKRS